MSDTVTAAVERAPARLIEATVLQIRDIPRSCFCGWDWRARGRRWSLVAPVTYCPWHVRF